MHQSNWPLHLSLMVFLIFGSKITPDVGFSPPKKTENELIRQLNTCLLFSFVIKDLHGIVFPLCVIWFQVTFLEAVLDYAEWQLFSELLPSPSGCFDRGGIRSSCSTYWERLFVKCTDRTYNNSLSSYLLAFKMSHKCIPTGRNICEQSC